MFFLGRQPSSIGVYGYSVQYRRVPTASKDTCVCGDGFNYGQVHITDGSTRDRINNFINRSLIGLVGEESISVVLR